ncbi:nucleoside hydrolase [Bifidobacterium gallicum]|uniref:Inosine-uridine preferring nucleoside hydrolase n=1 Tax=Bifidobacterium gallicum DSM 20093 = LMG 11596 TaxID=561180 RepID=D1NSQ7_9BIFI|nr:nucleoside hydrolase [Bifidobacterium gallicum]EFA23709.1 Inosine-uridine preferring nucleoside hydrolase [Bifidobacterium gallicum DSM 20093 = LMG 11596]KFI59268.1 putative cytidine/uridine-specific hydrolase [Bifidobacterium gallicum DSM 20093 = LMG 11596]
MSTRKLVLSVDTGIDDALALAALLGRDDLEIVGISCTYGNVLAEHALRNTQALLEVLQPDHQLPIVLGATHPSWAATFLADAGCAMFHGRNGLGDVDTCEYGAHTATPAIASLDDEGRMLAHTPQGMRYVDRDELAALAGVGVSIGGYAPSDRHAVLADGATLDAATTAINMNTTVEAPAQRTAGSELIAHAVRTWGPDVTVLATGPLTDVDTVLRLEPDLAERMNIVWMGGALTVPGNCYDLVSETNSIQDPEAANRVCMSGAQLSVVGLDVTHRCLMGETIPQRWSATGTAAGMLLARLAEFSIRANRASDAMFAAGMPLHDPLAALVAVEPDLVDLWTLPLGVQTHTGDWTGVRGRTVVDNARLNAPKAPHVRMAVNVHAQRSLDQFDLDVNRLLK